VTLRRGAAAIAAVATVALVAAAGPRATAAPTAEALPPIKHVFVIVLENEAAETSFGPGSPAPYLSKTLPAQGELLPQYFATGHASLDNYIAMVSGQAPNAVTQADCLVYLDFLPPLAVPLNDGQVVGQGCVLPAGVTALPDQLESAGTTWRGYMEDMGTPCRHPVVNAADSTQAAKVGDQYAARHNPFVYFHSIIDDDASCRQHVVDLSALTADLATVGSTPGFSFITPNLCHDGHDAPCVDGQPGGLVSADAFLKVWVPKILASPAYQQDGMLLVTFDESETADATACCGELPGPNSPLPGITGPGGGRIGAVVLSKYVTPGTVNSTPYNHYALLRTFEDLFGVPHLGFAGAAGLRPFGTDVFNASGAAPTTTAAATTTAAPRRGRTIPATGWSLPAGAVALLLAGAGVGLGLRRRLAAHVDGGSG
jgi:hypothetical protein